MFKKMIIVAGLAAAAVPANAAVNLVANGDFETTSFSGNFEFDSLGGASAGKLNNWTSTGGYNILFHSDNANTAAGNAAGQWSWTGREYMNASTASPTGGNFVALDGDQSFASAMSQTINGLTVGQTYNLSFYWGAGQLASRTGGPITEMIKVTFGNSVYNTNTISTPGATFSGWNLASTSFTATQTSQVLSFLSLGTPSGQPPVALLDGVSLTAAVPEPASWAMMIGGFGMVGGAMRRSRRAKVAFA